MPKKQPFTAEQFTPTQWEVLYRGRWIGIVESNLAWATGFWLSRPGFSLRQIGHA